MVFTNIANRPYSTAAPKLSRPKIYKTFYRYHVTDTFPSSLAIKLTPNKWNRLNPRPKKSVHRQIWLVIKINILLFIGYDQFMITSLKLKMCLWKQLKIPCVCGLRFLSPTVLASLIFSKKIRINGFAWLWLVLSVSLFAFLPRMPFREDTVGS